MRLPQSAAFKMTKPVEAESLSIWNNNKMKRAMTICVKRTPSLLHFSRELDGNFDHIEWFVFRQTVDSLPSSCYHFEYWDIGGIDTGSSYMFSHRLWRSSSRSLRGETVFRSLGLPAERALSKQKPTENRTVSHCQEPVRWGGGASGCSLLHS